MKVGFIGLGNMGSGMATNLLKAGHEVTVYNRTPSKARALVEQGAHHAAQVADACRGDAVITMLSDDSAVEGVVFGDAGVISSLGKRGIHVSSSTISMKLSERLAAAHAAGGQRFVAAPVFGRPEAAAAVSLTQMVTQIATYLRGWLGYFDDCQTPSVLQTLESWLRRRLRSVVWKQWKRGRTRFRELRKRNVSRDLAAQTAGSPHGPWRIANSPALAIALPNAYFAQLGLPPMVVRS